ncbi:MAG TPA: hypothetical protein ENH23_02930 [candidate division Zixibacteria bacterium]|nr:hypothetical protein [candidate division Zixibacteria bacterium]
MRDLGTMGESTFNLWCADAGLFANGSKIDKTGWDFLVEFPFDFRADPDVIHKSAIECRVQVKSTDDNKGKISITLSNLRRLITAHMPSFFVFLEFDGQSSAERAYVLHVEEELISKVLKRLHEIEQSDKENRFNKRTITIHYNNSHLLNSLDGNSLKENFLSHIGNDMSSYIVKKRDHLASTGFENGFAQINFTTQGKDNLRKLIDVSIGVEKSAKIQSFVGTKTRFGIKSKSPFVNAVNGRLEMPDIQPNTVGEICFKEDKLTVGFSFPSKLYFSPFNKMVPKELVKARVEGDFFDLRFNPFTGEAEHSFSFGEGIRLDVYQFRDALKLLKQLCTPNKRLFSELRFAQLPVLTFNVDCHGQVYPFDKELEALKAACEILSFFDIAKGVDTSLLEISYLTESIQQFSDLIDSSNKSFKVEFNVEDASYDPKKPTACICLTSVQIGSHVFGIFIVITGEVHTNDENGKYIIHSTSYNIEKKIVVPENLAVKREDLFTEIDPIEKKYSDDFQVIVMDT